MSEEMSLAEAAEFLGRDGRKPHTATLYRWCRRGCRGVKLEYRRYGRSIRVTREGLIDFGKNLAALDNACTGCGS